ncbi:hypothetical protein Avbf_03891, partial [Armadillidium vulgare]
IRGNHVHRIGEVRTSVPTISEQQSPQSSQRERPHQQVSNPYQNRERSRGSSTWVRGQASRNFQDNPRQSCAHCQKPGHSMSQCRARPLCRYCGKRGLASTGCGAVRSFWCGAQHIFSSPFHIHGNMTNEFNMLLKNLIIDYTCLNKLWTTKTQSGFNLDWSA